MLVNAARADKLPKVLRDKLLAQILDVDFGGAGLAGLLLKAGELLAALSDIATHRDHIAAVIFLEPRNYDRGIEAARVGEGHFLRFGHIEYSE